jgi:hypothetical protein
VRTPQRGGEGDTESLEQAPAQLHGNEVVRDRRTEAQIRNRADREANDRDVEDSLEPDEDQRLRLYPQGFSNGQLLRTAHAKQTVAARIMPSVLRVFFWRPVACSCVTSSAAGYAAATR